MNEVHSLKYRFFSFFSSVGLVKFLFCFFLFAVVVFHKFMLPIGKMNIKYRIEPTFRYLIDGIRYFSVFQISTSVSVSVFQISDIGSVFSVYRPMT